MPLDLGSMHRPEGKSEICNGRKGRMRGSWMMPGVGVPVFLLFSLGVGKGKGRHACESIDMCGDSWDERRTSLW